MRGVGITAVVHFVGQSSVGINRDRRSDCREASASTSREVTESHGEQSSSCAQPGNNPSWHGWIRPHQPADYLDRASSSINQPCPAPTGAERWSEGGWGGYHKRTLRSVLRHRSILKGSQKGRRGCVPRS